ncbi:unnamed protein product, partial [Rhizoctonia solani]
SLLKHLSRYAYSSMFIEHQRIYSSKGLSSTKSTADEPQVIYQSSSSSLLTSTTMASCTTATQRDTRKPRSRTQSRVEPQYGMDRRQPSCPRSANVDKVPDNRILKPLLHIVSLTSIQTCCLASITLLWMIYDFAFCAIKCVYWSIMDIIEQSEIGRFVTIREDSGREKGLNLQDFDLAELSDFYRAPNSIAGADVQGRMSRSRPRRDHNETPPNYMLHENHASGAGDTLWASQGVPYDSHTSQAYNPALIEAVPGGLDGFAYEPYTEWDRSSMPSPSSDHFYGNHHGSGCYASTANTFGGFQNPAAFPNLDHPNQAIITSINHHDTDPFINPDPLFSLPESYLPAPLAPSMPSIALERLHLDPSVNTLGLEPVSPGGTRRTRRPNTCDICGKEVRRPGVLEDHMNSHTGNRPHVCPHCPRVFTTKSNRQRHIGNFHGGGVGK